MLIFATLASGAPASTIEWDTSTLRLIARGGDYGRMVRLKDNRVACAYDRAQKMWIRHSSDDGKTFGDEILVAQEPECWLTNAGLLVLKNGELLYFWNERPIDAVRHQHKAAARPFRIRGARSTDNGGTWSEPQTLYAAGNSFQDGCWEPAAIELPSGEIQVYFANESPFRESDEQEISLVRSTDGGKNWSDAERASFRPKHRDGMPGPLLLAGDRGIVIAIEDNGHSGGAFKPVIVQKDQRWSALSEPLPPTWYGGAPFLAQLPSGRTLLSFQESEDGSIGGSRMAVCIGDADARNFASKTYPLPAPYPTGQNWNCLFVKDPDTVVAVSTATVEGKRGIWAIEGKVKE